MVSYIQTNLPVNDLVKLLHCWSRDSVGQEKFLAPSVDTQTHNYDTEYSNHHPAISTPKSKGLSHSKMIWWAIYIKLPVNAIARLPDSIRFSNRSMKLGSQDKNTEVFSWHN